MTPPQEAGIQNNDRDIQENATRETWNINYYFRNPLGFVNFF